MAERLIAALKEIKGAYSIVACATGSIIGVRDPHGIRPLVLGRLGDAHVLASESCALDVVGAAYVRDIEPGEMVIIDHEGVHSRRPFGDNPSRFCIFEYIYFARPDSYIGGTLFMKCARISAENLPAKRPVNRPISLFRFLIRACRPPSAMRRKVALLSSLALYEATISDGLLYNRPSRSGIWAWP